MKRNAVQKFFDKLFKRTIIINLPAVTGNELHIRELSDDEETVSLHHSLGISNDRLEQLGKLADAAYKKGAESNKSVVWALEESSKECKHANELYLLISLIEKIHHVNQDPFGMFLQQTFGKR